MTTQTLKNWDISNLGSTVDIIDGDRGKNYPKQDEFSDSGYCLFLNTKNVPSNSFSFDEKMFVTKEKDFTLRKGKLSRGDFVLTTRGTVGHFAHFSDKIPFENIRINSGMVILRPKKDGKLLSGFFKFYLDSLLFRDQVKSRSSGSAQPQLPIRDLSTFEIEIPDLQSQKQIADILSTYDDLIENNTRRIQILEQMAQAVYTEWFVNFRFPGHEKAKMIDIGGGAIFASVTRADLNNFPVVIPNAKVAGLFEDLVSPFDGLIFNISHNLSVLRRSRDLLLPKLVTGEIRV